MQRLERQQRRRPGGARRGIERVDDRDPCSDREPDRDAAAQRGADQQQGHRPELGGHEQPEAEAEHERGAHLCHPSRPFRSDRLCLRSLKSITKGTPSMP